MTPVKIWLLIAILLTAGCTSNGAGDSTPTASMSPGPGDSSANVTGSTLRDRGTTLLFLDAQGTLSHDVPSAGAVDIPWSNEMDVSRRDRTISFSSPPVVNATVLTATEVTVTIWITSTSPLISGTGADYVMWFGSSSSKPVYLEVELPAPTIPPGEPVELSGTVSVPQAADLFLGAGDTFELGLAATHRSAATSGTQVLVGPDAPSAVGFSSGEYSSDLPPPNPTRIHAEDNGNLGRMTFGCGTEENVDRFGFSTANIPNETAFIRATMTFTTSDDGAYMRLEISNLTALIGVDQSNRQELSVSLFGDPVQRLRNESLIVVGVLCGVGSVDYQVTVATDEIDANR